MNNEVSKEETSNFVALLEGLSYGSSLMSIDQKLKKCVEASEKTGKVSSLTVTIKIKPSQGEILQKFEIEDSAKANVPELAFGSTIAFKSDDGRIGFDAPGAADKRAQMEATAARKKAEAGKHITSVKGASNG